VLRLHEKGGKRHEVPCHSELELYLTAWMKEASISRDKKTPLFRSIGKGSRLGERAMSRFDVFHMIKRRAGAAALSYSTCCHSFRASGITTYLENGGALEQRADHRESRITSHN
jgi:integrase